MIVLTQTALKRLLIHTSINLKTLSDNNTSFSSSSSSSSSGQNSAQNSPNLVNLSQNNYILELQKEKVFTSLGILILNFSQVLANMNGKEKGNKRRKRHSQNGSKNEDRDVDGDGDGWTEEERKEGKDDEEDEEEEEEGEGEGEGEGDREGEGNDDGDDPCDLLSTVDLIINILTHVVSFEVRSRAILTFSCLALPCLALSCPVLSSQINFQSIFNIFLVFENFSSLFCLDLIFCLIRLTFHTHF